MNKSNPTPSQTKSQRSRRLVVLGTLSFTLGVIIIGYAILDLIGLSCGHFKDATWMWYSVIAQHIPFGLFLGIFGIVLIFKKGCHCSGGAEKEDNGHASV
ncbi:hypothetical protein N7513_008321 [Penicillium frequentans]|nr:hypothetical protein N7513_008321 [Penicillium glabrum]